MADLTDAPMNIQTHQIFWISFCQNDDNAKQPPNMEFENNFCHSSPKFYMDLTECHSS